MLSCSGRVDRDILGDPCASELRLSTLRGTAVVTTAEIAHPGYLALLLVGVSGRDLIVVLEGAGLVALNLGRKPGIGNHQVEFFLELVKLGTVKSLKLFETGSCAAAGSRAVAVTASDVTHTVVGRRSFQRKPRSLLDLGFGSRFRGCFRSRGCTGESRKFVEQTHRVVGSIIGYIQCRLGRVDGEGSFRSHRHLLLKLLYLERDFVEFLGNGGSALQVGIALGLLHGIHCHGVERAVALAAEAAEIERATVGTSDAAAGIATFGAECFAGAHLRAAEGTLGGAGISTDGTYHHTRLNSGAT